MRANLATLVEDFRRHGAETAVVAHRGNRRYATTYGELAALAGRFAAELERRGIGPGDRVVIWGENSAEWIGVFFGCILRAVIAVPLDAAGTADFAARVIRDTGPKLVVGDAGLLAQISGPWSVVSGQREALEIPRLSLSGIEASLPVEALWAPSEAIEPHTPFQIVFTSGTTAEPRGIVHTHRNILVTLRPIEREMQKYLKYERIFHPLRFLHSLPLSHVFGQFMALWIPGLLAAEVHFSEHLEPSRITELIRRERISVLIAVPRVLQLLRVHLLGRFPGLGAEIEGVPGRASNSKDEMRGSLHSGGDAASGRDDASLGSGAVPGREDASLRGGEGERATARARANAGVSPLRAARFGRDDASLGVGRENRQMQGQRQGQGRNAGVSPLRAARFGRDDASCAGGAVPGRDDASRGGWRGILKRWWRYRRVHRALGWKFWAVISGGATLPAELETFWNRLGYALIQGYGMTETAALVTLNHPFHIKAGTIGKPMPGREVKLTDEGEILVRGEMLAEATWQGGAMHMREGEWLATGDLAEKSESGELRFLGRKGDVIVTGAGMNIHPADLETALATQPGVRAAVVVGCDLAGGAGAGETVAVAVVLFAGTGAELDAAVAAANRGLAEFQQIRRVLRWPELEFPYTSTGKLLRRKVTEWACGALTGRGQGAGNGAAAGDAVLALIAEVTGEPVPAAADANALRLSEDLHLDSLGRVQLQSALEQRFSVELEDDAAAGVTTVGELRGLIGRQLVESGGIGRGDGKGKGKGEMRGSLHSGGDAASGRDDASLRGRDGAAVAGREGAALRGGENASLAGREGASLAEREGGGLHVYPRWPWSWPVQALRVVWMECVMRPLVGFLAAPRVTFAAGARAELTDSTLQATTPLLILCNHVTYYDGALVLYALPGRLRRHVAAAMSGEMLLDYRAMRNQPNALENLLAPAAYWLLTALFNVFPLPRARGFRRSFAHAGEAMDRGYSVLIFPEGTRSQTGQMNRFRPGIGLLAAESRVPILPVAIRGLHPSERRSPGTPGLGEIQAEHARWFRSGRIEVRIGELIPAAEDGTDPAALTARLEQAVRALR